MKLKHLVTSFVTMAIAASGLFVPAAAVGSTDATLASLSTPDTYQTTYMSPDFQSDITSYAFATDNDYFEISANATDENATVVIVEGSTSTPLPRDQYTQINVEPGIHDFDVIVTAEDGSTTKTYNLRLASRAALTPIVHGLSQTEGGIFGGERVTVTIENWTNTNYFDGWRRNECWYEFNFDNRSVYGVSDYIDEVTGFRKYVFEVPSTEREAGSVVDFDVETTCSFYDNWNYYHSKTTLQDAYTYLPLDLESTNIPDVLYPGESLTLNGFGFSRGMDVGARLTDPNDPSNNISLSRWGYTGNESVEFYLRLYRELGYDGVANLSIYPCTGESCDYDNPFFTDTIEIRQATPQNITFTPGSMNTDGGKEVIVSGRYLFLDEDDPDFYLNDISLSSESIQLADEGDYAQYRTGMDRYRVTMPEDLAPGEYTLSVMNENDLTGTAAAKFIVGAKPVITTISPATVANVGGSVVTINGENFGTRGTPTVTINGVKALNVKRVNSTKITATVPALGSTTGAVDVVVISPQNGGASTPASLPVAAATVNPTITSLSVTTGISTGGTEVIITGTNLGSLATTGVTFGGKTARIVTASATSLKVQSPAVAAGAADVVVSTSTGQVTSAGAFTYTAAPAITSLSSRTFASSIPVNEAVLTLTGVGFGATGTIKIGTNAAIAYTSTNGGTTIEDVSVAGQPVGRNAVVVTPTGSTKSLTTSFTVTAPTIHYVGPDNYDSNFENPSIDNWSRGAILNITGATSNVVRIEGSGFGYVGHIMVGDTEVEATYWEASVITFIAPPLAPGKYEVTVVPEVGPSVSRAVGLIYQTPVDRPEILRAEATVYPSPDGQAYLGARNEFDPTDPALSNRYRIVGSDFLGTDNGATTTVQMNDTIENEESYQEAMPVEVISITDTEILIDISRESRYEGFKSLRVITNNGEAWMREAIYYSASNYPNVIQYRWEGSCLIEKAGLVENDGWFYVEANQDVFGTSGTVTIGDDAERITLTGSYNSTYISIMFNAQSVQLANPYGPKTIIVNPDQEGLLTREFSFGCVVYPEYELTLNGVTDPVVQSARDPYTVAATATKNVYSDSPITIPNTAYEYMKVEDFDNLQYWSGTPGLPKAVGHYYIGLAGWHETITKNPLRYASLLATNRVELTLTGSPLTVTPVLVGGGNTIEFRGYLGDGTNGSPDDFDFTQTTTADAITGVTWEYRDHFCETNGYGANQNWNSGLPTAGANQNMCGGDGNTASTWDIRVANVTMDTTGTDQSIYYQITREVFNLTITPKAITLVPRNMDKAYDGNNTANFMYNFDFEGADPDFPPYIEWVNAYFDDEIPGVNKTITPSGPLALGWGWNWYYTLTNPDATFTGTIFKATAEMKLSGASAVTIESGATVDITVENTHLDNGSDVSGQTDIAPVVLVSSTPTVCSIDGTTVTPIAAGDCVIEATQAASTYFNAGVAASDNDLLVETFTIFVVGSPVALNVIADDITIAEGSNFEPSVQIIGAFGDDTIDGLQFEYYLDGVLVDGVPTERGVYTIVPVGGNINAYDTSAYDLEGTTYTAGTLTITGQPPTVLSVDPASGPTTGGNTLTINGYELDLVTQIMIGETVYEPTDFTVSADGSQITLIVAPGEVGTVDLVITIEDASVTESYTYIAPDVPDTETVLDLKLELAFDTKLKGSKATISGGGLKSNSAYTLEMHSSPILIYAGTTDADGNFTELVTIPAKVCAVAGDHELILTGIAPDGSVKTSTQWLWIDSNCTVQERSAKGPITKASIGKILFAYRSAVLTKKAKQTLWALMPLIRKSKTIEVFGYTQTQNKSAASKKANILLAKQRTYAIAKFLKYVGIKAKVVVRPKGPVQPISNWQKYNRRVELTIKL